MAKPSPVGNVYDKYGTRNPVAQLLMSRFLASLYQLYDDAAPQTVLEVGCGEGRLADRLYRRRAPLEFEAIDLDLSRLDADVHPDIRFTVADAYALPWADDTFDLIVCCEVLEHVERPADLLSEVRRVARQHVILSTPREPIWCALNMARGQYWSDFGNTPGHIQHFSRRGLLSTVRPFIEVETVRTPLPWTMLKGRPR